MLIEIRSDSVESTLDCLRKLKNSEDVIHFKDQSPERNTTYWFSVLNECRFLLPDYRHFNSDNKLTSIKWWTVEFDPAQPETYAHSNTAQPLHTDNAWFSDPADVNFFYMEKQAKSGGRQIIYPLSQLIADLKSKHPKLYEKLITIEVLIKKGEGKEEHKTTIINFRLSQPRIFWNFYRTVKKETIVSDMCQEFFYFLLSQQNAGVLTYLDSKSGDAFAFNDSQLLHARESFEAQQKGDRILHQSMWKYVR